MNFRTDFLAINMLAVEKQALALRKTAAKQLANMNWQTNVDTSISNHFAPYSEILPLPSGRDALAFNTLVTESVLKEHVLTLDDPTEVTFLGSKVIEQTYYILFDPTAPLKPIKNLSVAKHFGTFFTPPDICSLMVEELNKCSSKTLLDPCVGSGALLCSALILSPPDRYKKIIGFELDETMSRWASLLLHRVAELTGYQGDIEVGVSDGIEAMMSDPIFSISDSLNIIINPPYGRLRITSDRATNSETTWASENNNAQLSVSDLHKSVTSIGSRLRQKYHFFSDGKGIPELSKLFYRVCAELVSRGANLAIISPDSWMSGIDGKALRKFIVENKLLHGIYLIDENQRKFSTVNQSTAISILTQRDRATFFVASWPNQMDNVHTIEYSRIKGSLVIPRASSDNLDLFQKLAQYQRFSEVAWLTNARGEVDQTAQKELFSTKRTSIPLIRGEHIDRYSFRHTSSSEKPSFLLAEEYQAFISKRPKQRDFLKPRIVGRQCSYAQQKRRLIFSVIPAKHGVGNSCNYLTVEADTKEHEQKLLFRILGLVNSAVLEWFFRIENSNNHVANYEIDNFPYPSNDKWLPLLEWLAFKIHESTEQQQPARSSWLSEIHEAVVALAYDLDPEKELRLILSNLTEIRTEKIVNFAKHLARGARLPIPLFGETQFNNALPTLSELDRRIISHVPEGGNWQSIPEDVPSERLKQIREMSAERGVVRTTYYGRLRRDQPAYTINTYFNRPGNGTHIHPVENRTLTSREAARLQSFPDSYIFCGSEGAIRDQIGNAVPPLLGAAIGEKFLPFATSRTCVDVFCGAGGISLGLEMAGWHAVAAIDHNKDALDTYCINRPCTLEPVDFEPGKTSVFHRDLHNLAAFEDLCLKIERSLGNESLDMLIGGPPCQGFSHAGFRLDDDKRNDLASIYLHFAERLRPRIVILENVEGLTTFKGGQVLRDICSTLREIGYRVNEPVWKLCAEQFGVPQMRRRVFVVATTDQTINLAPPIPKHEKCAGRRAEKVSGSLLPNLPPPHTVSDCLEGLSLPNSGTTPGGLARWLSDFSI